MIDLEPKKKENMYKAVLTLVVVLCVYFGIKAWSVVTDRFDNKEANANVITVTGHGEVNATPDLATVYFSVEDSKDTQKAASESVNTKVKKVLDFLKTSGIEDKDVKTEGYNSYPKYSQQKPCPVYYGGPAVDVAPCEVGESKIIGYTVSQSITVKIRKIDDNLSKVIDGINKFGVTNMSGPTLTIDDEDGLKADARKEAIKQAREKAKVLAKDLGVRLGDVTSFNENYGGYPMYYGKTSMALDSAAVSAPAPEIPKGENTISSDVTITYEIR